MKKNPKEKTDPIISSFLGNSDAGFYIRVSIQAKLILWTILYIFRILKMAGKSVKNKSSKKVKKKIFKKSLTKNLQKKVGKNLP